MVLSANVSDQIGQGIGATVGATIGDVKKIAGRTLNAGLNFSVLSTRASTNFAYSIDANALGLGAGLAGILPGGHQYSVTSIFPNTSDNFRNFNARLTFASKFEVRENVQAPYRLNAAFIRTPLKGTTQALAFNTGTGFGRMNLTIGNQWKKIAPRAEPSTTRLTGSLTASWAFFPVSIRGGLNYRTIPKLKTTALNGRISWTIRRNISSSLSFDHQIATASTRLQGALSLVTELFTISPSFTATTVGHFFAFLTIRFSNAYDPKYR